MEAGKRQHTITLTEWEIDQLMMGLDFAWAVNEKYMGADLIKKVAQKLVALKPRYSTPAGRSLPETPYPLRCDAPTE